MKFSIIIPSYNQPDYIAATLDNVLDLKAQAASNGHDVEILLFDSASPEPLPSILKQYEGKIDVLELKKDAGQYDAINKGILASTGVYWTWLNTDDTLDVAGTLQLMDYLSSNPTIDYCYGTIDYIDEKGSVFRRFEAKEIDFDTLVTHTPGIFQQGSFFRKAFTDKIGLLAAYNCCFDYEYVLRCLKAGANMKVFTQKVANFRQHKVSKTGSLTPVFIREQLAISAKYGRKPYHYLTLFSQLRLLKHRLFPR